MGCGEKCPYVPGLKVLDWPLVDPKGKSIEEVRPGLLELVPLGKAWQKLRARHTERKRKGARGPAFAG